MYIEAHPLQALVVAPCGDAPGDLVEAHDAIIGADVERLIIGSHDALHAVVGECAIVLVVAAVVVVPLIEDEQAMVVGAHIHGAVGILIHGVDPEAFDRQVDTTLRVRMLSEAE